MFLTIWDTVWIRILTVHKAQIYSPQFFFILFMYFNWSIWRWANSKWSIIWDIFFASINTHTWWWANLKWSIIWDFFFFFSFLLYSAKHILNTNRNWSLVIHDATTIQKKGKATFRFEKNYILFFLLPHQIFWTPLPPSVWSVTKLILKKNKKITKKEERHKSFIPRPSQNKENKN